MIELQVLGPAVLRIDGEPVRLGPQKRTLLLALLLAVGQAIPSARLADVLWDGAAPDGWPTTLRSHIHQLRQTLDGLAPRTRGTAGSILSTEQIGWSSAYALRIPVGQVDAFHFERLTTEGRNALGAALYGQAAAGLREALALWRGQPFADVNGRSFAVAAIRRLDAMHRAAVQARIEADTHLGLHRELIGELEAILTEWPEDEWFRCLLVSCLLRSGRRIDAARECRDGIEIMLGQGLDFPRLERLQRQCLGSYEGA